jgi:Fic family protein
MEDLLAFARRDDLDVLPQIAVAHAQLETIHPFPDGNGRTGRALAHAMLRSSGTTQQVTVPISAGLLASPEDYFRALTSYRQGDVIPIVRVFTASSFAAIANAKRLVNDLGEVRSTWETALNARRGSTARRALEVLIEQPVVTVQYLASRLGVSNVAANSALPVLEAAGVVRRRNEGRRNRHWQADGVLEALDGFAARARRATY